MLMFPLEFRPAKYPGYVWNTKNGCLYSFKYGQLKELTVRKPNRWTVIREPYYIVSHEGRKIYILKSDFNKLKPDHTVRYVNEVRND